VGYQARTLAIAAFFFLVYLGGRWVAATTRVPVKGDVDVSSVPMRIGQWEGQDCSRSEAIADQREGVVERIYRGPGGLVARVIVIYSRNWRAIHPPEMCLTAVGWRMHREFTVDVAVPDGVKGRARALVMDRHGDTLGGVYLYVDKDRVSDSWASLFARMVDSSQETRSLLAVYAQNPVRQSTGEQLTETARQLVTALLPHVQRSIRKPVSSARPPEQ
jgi:hypothetical protein